MYTTTNRPIHKLGIENHEYNYIQADEDLYIRACRKCVGLGRHGRDADTCPRCDGDQTEYTSGTYTLEEAEVDAKKRGQARRRRNERRFAEHRARVNLLRDKIEKYRTAHPDVYDHLKGIWDLFERTNGDYPLQEDVRRIQRVSNFELDLARRLFEYQNVSKDITLGMTETLQEILRERTEKADSQHPIVEGRQHVSGRVVSRKKIDSVYGVQWKMLVEDDRGFRIYGTVPKGLTPGYVWDDDLQGYAELEGVQPGDRVQFTATLKPSDDDPKFGFYSRPTKVEVEAPNA